MTTRAKQLNHGLIAVLLALGTVVAIGACATGPSQQTWDWRWNVTEADRLADDERYDEALQRYAELRERAPDELEARYITYRMGYVEEERGNYQRAIEYYLELLEHHAIYDPIEDNTPRALFRVGLILYDHLDRPDEALKIWRHVIHYYPAAEGPAWRSLDCIISHYEAFGRGADEQQGELVRFLASEYRALQNTRFGDNLLYWLAHWHRHYLDDPDMALELFYLLRERYWESSLRDQGDWQIVELLHEKGEYETELTLLEAIASEREENLILGPYVTENMENAAYRAGQLRLEQLDDPRGAIEAWESFLDTWIHSLLRDDAARGIVDAAVDIGDQRLIREKAEWFLRDFHESRYVDEVRDILERHAPQSSTRGRTIVRGSATLRGRVAQ